MTDEHLNFYANIYLTLNGKMSKTTFEEFVTKMMERKNEKTKKALKQQ